MTSEIYLTPTGHAKDCNWHVDQYPWECTCGFIPRKKAMDDLIAQDADLIAKLRDEDSYYRVQEKHWCIDAEELERQRLAAADRIEALTAENERLREALTHPHNVHVNMLAGYIAKPWPRSIWHIYGRELLDAMPDEYRAALAGDSHD